MTPEEKSREVYPLVHCDDWDKEQELVAQQLDRRVAFVCGYEQAEKDLGWHSVEESLPEMDEEVIVLMDEYGTAPIYKVGVGHIVDRRYAMDFNGWNIPGVKFWMPMPKIPEE